jgi:hypothetical protein
MAAASTHQDQEAPEMIGPNPEYVLPSQSPAEPPLAGIRQQYPCLSEPLGSAKA